MTQLYFEDHIPEINPYENAMTDEELAGALGFRPVWNTPDDVMVEEVV